jgi:hypothetical protein
MMNRERGPRMSRLLAGSAALAVAGGLALAGASAAEATTVVTQNYVLSKTKTANYTQTGQTIGRCSVTTSGATCTISNGKTATRTIGVALSATRSFVAGQLSISSASTVTTTTACASPKLKSGQSWVAHPQGNLWKYKVRSVTSVDGRLTYDQTSGALSAFDPLASYITCGLG